MIKNYSKQIVLWTKHASEEVLEDNFEPRLIEQNLDKVVELPEFNGEKKRGIIRLNGKYCTLIYIRINFGIKIITCWESNPTDIQEYKQNIRKKQNG